MVGFLACRSGGLPTNDDTCHALGLPKGSLAAFHATDFTARFGKQLERGMAAVISITTTGHLVGWGDCLDNCEKIPASSRADDLLDWFTANFARFCALWSSGDSAILWTDPLAGCPLFYSTYGPALIAATEAKAVDFATSHIAARGFAPSERSISNDAHVQRVAPGSKIVFERQNGIWVPTRRDRYYRIPTLQHHDDIVVCADRIKAALSQTIVRQVGRLAEIAVMISGGVDSSAVAALARPLVRRMKSFTVGTPFGDEFSKAREIASLLGTDHHQLTMRPSDLSRLLPELAFALETDDPEVIKIAAPAAFLQVSLQDYSEILLTGYGADLIFGGTADPNWHDVKIEKFLRRQIQQAMVSGELSPAFAARHNVTVRNPYWSSEVMSAGMAIPARLKVAHRIKKFVLRQAFNNLLAPGITWRPKIGIHEGTAMSRMLASVLGTADRQQQRRHLKKMAISYAGSEYPEKIENMGKANARLAALA